MDGMRPPTAAANGVLWGERARHWADIQEATARAAFDAVLDRTGTGVGTRLLDIGCGSGMAARLAADRGATVAGIDAAEPLLAIARERTPAGDFLVADLEALPFADAGFDVIIGVNSIQYAGNPALALGEARRVAAPDAVIAVIVWGEPAGMAMAAVIAALGPLLPPPPPGAGGPFALSGESALRSLAEAAALTVERIEDVATTIVYPDLATALHGLDSSGVAARARGVSGADAVTKAHAAALAPFVQPDGSVHIGAVFRLLLARA